jgi:uncharacterized membrane protein YhfC
MIEACLAASGILCIALPIALAVWWHRRSGASYIPFAYGAIIFVVFALVLKLPWLIPLGTWVKSHPSMMNAFLAVSAVSAGLFEEVGRYIGYRLFLKGDTRTSTAVMYGLGHGGIESILFAGVNLLATSIMLMLLANGTLSNPEIATKLHAATQSLTPVKALVPPVAERIGAIMFHVAMSLVVLQAVARRQLRWVAYAIVAHAALDTLAVSAGPLHVNVYLLEALVVVLGVAALYVAAKIAREGAAAQA